MDLRPIKSIPIARVAADFGFKLSPRGIGRCRLPGHDDQNPSFALRERSNGFRCFACQRQGSVIDLAMTMLSMDFPGACHWLSDQYLSGRERPRPTVFRSEPAATSAPLDAESNADPEIYGWLLDQSPLQAAGRAYLEGRAISAATLAHFRVGQIGNGAALLRQAVARFGSVRLECAGLVVNGTRGSRLVFPSGYLLFPFLRNEAVVYLQARRADDATKYRWVCPAKLLPPPYNLDVLASQAVTVAICEGVTDVLSAHEIGMAPIGLLGAAHDLDSAIIDDLVGRNIAIFGDADRSGAALAQRLKRRLAARGLTVITKRLPAGVNDLNDYLRSRREQA